MKGIYKGTRGKKETSRLKVTKLGTSWEVLGKGQLVIKIQMGKGKNFNGQHHS